MPDFLLPPAGAPQLLSRHDSWRLCLGLGLFLVLILLLLQPFGTEHYRSPARVLMLAGYGLCIAVPGLLCHALLRHWRPARVDARRHAHHQAGLEWGLLLAWAALAVLLSYAYSASVIAPRALAWRHAFGFAASFGLPLLLLMLPVLMWWRARGRAGPTLGSQVAQAGTPEPGQAPAGDAQAPQLLRLLGRNRGECVALAPGQFIYAQAQQNYVNLVWWTDDGLQQQLLRTTLAALAEQLPGALRIHRSYLLAPEHLLQVEGPRRQRLALVRHLDAGLPVSAEFEAPQTGPGAAAIRPAAGRSVKPDD